MSDDAAIDGSRNEFNRMKINRILACIVLVAPVLVIGCEQKNEPASSSNQTTTVTRSSSNNPGVVQAPAADNTVKNSVDRNMDTKTPFDQSATQTDTKITADVRRAIMDDKTMSFNAQNCKIITEKSGVVTLRGVVDSQVEKDSIESKAKSTTGVTSVDNQLEIKQS